ncbi:odorant receptor 82a-like [Microplitis mediator]|uniref:odorant receptor 82a-like n=1 Tax=Microplitis mediator TaxID=375433 RepID=UPI0025542391|nr:odorant receptor 82a-like [Microplitis mediator]
MKKKLDDVLVMQRTPIETHRKTVDITILLFKFCGCWDYDSSKFSLKLVNFLSRTINWACCLCILIPLAVDIIKNIKSLEIITNDVGYLAPLYSTFLKSIKVQTLQKEIGQLINSIHQPIDKLRYSSDVGVLTKIRTAICYQNFDYSVYASVLSFVFFAVIIISASVSNTGLPMRGYFPFNETISPAFQIVFLLQFWSVLINCAWALLVDLLLIGLIRWINVQLYVLQNNYENCRPDISDRDNFLISHDNYTLIKNYNFFKVPEEQFRIRSFVAFQMDEINVKNDSFTLRFKTCIKHHQRIIDSVNNYNDLFNSMLFVQIFNNQFVACLCLFQGVLAMKQNKDFINYFILSGSSVTELFYFCFFGSQLIIEAEKVHESQWKSGWDDNICPEVRDLMLNALLQSMKPLKIIAGYFFVFSVETFVSVLQKAYSYFAILNTVIDEND